MVQCSWHDAETGGTGPGWVSYGKHSRGPVLNGAELNLNRERAVIVVYKELGMTVDFRNEHYDGALLSGLV